MGKTKENTMTAFEKLQAASKQLPRCIAVGHLSNDPLDADVTLETYESGDRKVYIKEIEDSPGTFTVRCGISVTVCNADQFLAVLEALDEAMN